MNAVTDLLANRSAEEKRALLVELLRELAQQSPAQPISIQDESGKLFGMFSPTVNDPAYDFSVEGSPAFFRELERRRQTNNLITAEEFQAYLRSNTGPK
jgi:hypothetical protein